MEAAIAHYLANGSDPNFWFISKFLMAFLGGLAVWFIQRNIFVQPGRATIHLRQGLLFSFFSAIGGLTIINPPDAIHCFAAGIVGVAAISNMTQPVNRGTTEPTVKLTTTRRQARQRKVSEHE